MTLVMVSVNIFSDYIGLREESINVTEPEMKTPAPDFEKCGGLLPAIAQDDETGDILMLAYMNQLAFQKTVETGEMHYWSRSRQELWHKGGTSGHVQKVKALFLDCDGDALVARIEQLGGAACHTGHRTCFHFRHDGSRFNEEGTLVFDPREVYGK